MVTKRFRAVVLFAVISSMVTGACSVRAQSAPQLIVVPTLSNDHQFNLDYTVAHLEALLDQIKPDAILVDDYADWLANGCLLQATSPENHVALRYAKTAGIPILGTSLHTPPAAYAGAMRAEDQYRTRSMDDARAPFRPRLDRTAAAIARDYSFAVPPARLERLLSGGFASKAESLTPQMRTGIQGRAVALVDSVRSRMRENPRHSRWVAVLWWPYALAIGDSLQARGDIALVSVERFLPIDAAGVDRHLDASNLGWILSGVLDEWFGMWAPQAFPGERVSAMLRRLHDIAPEDPATKFLQARWFMQQRDYEAAAPLLRELVQEAGDARFSFPLNGKWIRPPWSSIAWKAKLNLAFIHDYRGERDAALALYRELLLLGDELNREAQAAGYVYDDILRVIESYTVTPYSGMPDEAFRHFPLKAGVPECAPKIGVTREDK